MTEWQPALNLVAGHMIHHLDPARLVKAIDLIATGGITRDSVQAEAATWGTPA
jgi:hypothetical protein